MAPTPAGRRRQPRRLRQAQRRLEELQAQRGQAASKRKPRGRLGVSPSDPEAAVGQDKEGLFRPLYNVQLVDDLDSPFILGYEVLDQPNDAGALGPLSRRLREAVGRPVGVLLADTAYTGGPDLAAAEAAGVMLYGPLPKDGARRTSNSPKAPSPGCRRSRRTCARRGTGWRTRGRPGRNARGRRRPCAHLPLPAGALRGLPLGGPLHAAAGQGPDGEP